MLDKIRAEDCTLHIGKPCRTSCPDSPIFNLAIESVEEKTHLRRPQDSRAPFSVLLKGPLEPSFLFGTFDIDIGGELFLHGVHIARIDPPWGLNPDSAYYQVIFN